MTHISKKTISKVAVKEKYLRKNHFNSLNVWWARRPITAMRSLLINEIISRNGNKYLLPNELISHINPDKNEFKRFKETYDTNKLNLLDTFSGGGSIPFEGARLGLNTYSYELNPIAAVGQESVFKSNVVSNFPQLLKKYGKQTIDRASKRSEVLYQFQNEDPYVIFWTRTSVCPECQNTMHLGRLNYFKKRGEEFIVFEDNKVKTINSDDKYEPKKIKGFNCSHCNTSYSYKDIKEYCKTKRLGSHPIALCNYQKPKEYLSISPKQLDEIQSISKKIDEELKKLHHLIPKTKVEKKAGVINPTLYDLKYASDIFNKRQLFITTVLIDEICKTYESVKTDYDLATAKQIVLGLTSLIEFHVDWNNKYTMWIPQNEQTGRSLAGPGVGMKWDYIEVNPFYHKGSNFYSKLDRIVNTYEAIEFDGNVHVHNQSSTNLELEDNSIDIVLTDPPYYDSIDYTGLSEFFRPWFEVLISNTYQSNVNLTNEVKKEAIVELSNSSDRGGDHYLKIMSEVFNEIERVLKINGTFLMLFSHKTLEGWKVISESLNQTNLYINKVIPIEMERIARPRAMSYQSLNGVIVFEIQKKPPSINSLDDDIRIIIDDIKSNEISESQTLICLAALSCKYSQILNKRYKDVHEQILSEFESKKLDFFHSTNIDELTKMYVNERLKGKSKKSILEKYDLIKNENLKGLTEIDPNLLPNSTLKDSIEVVNVFKNNNKVTIDLSSDKRSKVQEFLGLIGGNTLNTLKKRSSNSELKVIRSTLSKITKV